MHVKSVVVSFSVTFLSLLFLVLGGWTMQYLTSSSPLYKEDVFVCNEKRNWQSSEVIWTTTDLTCTSPLQTLNVFSDGMKLETLLFQAHFIIKVEIQTPILWLEVGTRPLDHPWPLLQNFTIRIGVWATARDPQ